MVRTLFGITPSGPLKNWHSSSSAGSNSSSVSGFSTDMIFSSELRKNDMAKHLGEAAMM